MPKRVWEKLARDLTDQRSESAYLERIKARVFVEQTQDALEAEIRREMASALGRAEDKLNRSLAELEAIGEEIADLLARPAGAEDGLAERVNARVAAYNRQRDVARRCLWELVVHREALGIRRNEGLTRFYPIPARKEALFAVPGLRSADPPPPAEEASARITPNPVCLDEAAAAMTESRCA